MEREKVHAVQHNYRKVLQGMSRPGEIIEVSEEVRGFEWQIGCYPATLLQMVMFLDAEVGFHLVTQKQGVRQQVAQMTYGKWVPLEEADYIFVLQDATEEQIEEVLVSAKVGDLIDPHQSATVIMEVKALTEQAELVLKGPGIKSFNTLSFGQGSEWIDVRQCKNQEYPLGIDMIFVDGQERVACLPRTTKVARKGEIAWDM